MCKLGYRYSSTSRVELTQEKKARQRWLMGRWQRRVVAVRNKPSNPGGAAKVPRRQDLMVLQQLPRYATETVGLRSPMNVELREDVRCAFQTRLGHRLSLARMRPQKAG